MAVFNEPTKWAQTLGKDADVTTIPDTAGDTDPSIDKIFPAVFSIPLAHGGKAIPRSVLNGLFKLLGDWSFYQQNGGVSTYSESFDYVAGRVVLYTDGNLYKCKKSCGASSTVVAPDSDTAYWQRLDNFVRSVNSVNADDNGNVSITSVNHATSADSATKATNDSSNRNIVNTYALKSNYPDRIKFAFDTTFKDYVNVTVDETTLGLITTYNIGSQSVNHATSADSATKATNDSSNRNIVNTYALKSNYPDRIKFAFDTTFKGYVNVTVDQTTWGLITNHNISSQSVNHATSADNATTATNATNLGGYPATKYIRSVTGEIKWFAFNTVPDGYIICNGANVSRTTYADLFNAIGTTFGSGDGSTTFALPNLIDKFAQGSTTVGTYKSAGLPDIIGGLRGNYFKDDPTNFGAFHIDRYGNIVWGPSISDTPLHDCSYIFSAQSYNSIYGNSTTVQPPALTLLPCIKY